MSNSFTFQSYIYLCAGLLLSVALLRATLLPILALRLRVRAD